MREFKIIIGFILIGVSVFTFFNTYDQYYEEELYGAITVFVILIAIGVGLIYNAEYKNIKEEKRKETEYKKERAIINDISEKEENLINLRDKGILSEEEFNSKISKVRQDKAKTKIEKTKEFQQLYQLYNSKILTTEEFDSKVNLLITKQNIEPQEEGLKNKLTNTGYHQIGEFKEGRAKIWDENQNYGFIDKNYDVILKPKFDLVEDFSDGLAMVMLSGDYGFINKDGELIIHLQYDDAKSFENGLAKVRLREEEFYINKTGKEVDKI